MNESDANSGTGSAGSASGAAGDSNSQNGQENVDNSGNQTGGSQETEVKPVLPEEKDYEYFYDKETGKIKVTFNIKEDAKGDQTIELSKVMEEINAAGKKQFEQWFQFWRKEDNLCGTGDSHRRTGASGTAGGSAD